METTQPFLEDEHECPTWFWCDDKGSGWSFVDAKKQIMMSGIDFYLFALSRKDKFPVYFILDKHEGTISNLVEKLGAEQTFRTWLTRKENEKLYGVRER